jgi:hypothetical protein
MNGKDYDIDEFMIHLEMENVAKWETIEGK